jgi:hypothetical protein
MFDIPTWDNRIYAYENDVLYSFSTPAYYSSGSRIALLTRYRPFRYSDIWIKIVYTNYSGRNSFDSVSGRKKDAILSLTVQLRVRI